MNKSEIAAVVDNAILSKLERLYKERFERYYVTRLRDEGDLVVWCWAQMEQIVKTAEEFGVANEKHFSALREKYREEMREKYKDVI